MSLDFSQLKQAFKDGVLNDPDGKYGSGDVQPADSDELEAWAHYVAKAVVEEFQDDPTVTIDAYNTSTQTVNSSGIVLSLDDERTLTPSNFSRSGGEIGVAQQAFYEIHGCASFTTPSGSNQSEVEVTLQRDNAQGNWSDFDGAVARTSWSGDASGALSIPTVHTTLAEDEKVRMRVDLVSGDNAETIAESVSLSLTAIY